MEIEASPAGRVTFTRSSPGGGGIITWGVLLLREPSHLKEVRRLKPCTARDELQRRALIIRS